MGISYSVGYLRAIQKQQREIEKTLSPAAIKVAKKFGDLLPGEPIDSVFYTDKNGKEIWLTREQWLQQKDQLLSTDL